MMDVREAGKLGGKARADRMTPEERSAVARKAVRARERLRKKRKTATNI